MTKTAKYGDKDKIDYKFYQPMSMSQVHVLPSDVRSSLVPLVTQLTQYDSLRLNLEQNGGEISNLQEITSVLNAKVTAVGRYETCQASLTDQKQLKQLISNIGLGTVHLDIRKQRHDMPVYYLCRVARDYWAEYSLIVEDLYMSPGYVLPDDRFARLMYMGHESYYLRMSRFRSAVDQMAGCPGDDSDRIVDCLLHEVGRHCMASMWHEDQQAAKVAARHFGLTHFQQTVELLYLCQGADLCELRSNMSTFKLDFFATIYPQPALLAFLETLQSMNGKELNLLPQRSVLLFARLNSAFTEFLGTEVTCNIQASPAKQTELELNTGTKTTLSKAAAATPLYKLVFGNYYQLELLTETLRRQETFCRAVRKLEKQSKAIIRELINQDGSASDGRALGRALGKSS